MHSETPPRLRLLAGGRTHQSRTREQLAQQLGRDATLA